MRKMTDEDWVVGGLNVVNLNGTFYCTSAVCRPGPVPLLADHQYQFRRRTNGRIWPFWAITPVWAASSPSLKPSALEMAKFNITANAIAPGFTSTETGHAIPEEIAPQIKAKIPWWCFAAVPVEEIAVVPLLSWCVDFRGLHHRTRAEQQVSTVDTIRETVGLGQ